MVDQRASFCGNGRNNCRNNSKQHRYFRSKIAESLLPSRDAQDTILTFIILHELWHVKQFELVGPAPFQNPKEKPVLECQADVEAARVIVLRDLQMITDLSDKVQIAAASKSIDLFRSSWSLLVDRSPVESDAHHHLTKRQRILALQFALWRAYFEKFQSVSNPAKQLVSLTGKLMARTDSSEAVRIHDWSSVDLRAGGRLRRRSAVRLISFT